MINKMPTMFLYLFIFFVINFLIFFSPFDCNAQKPSGSINLEGEWNAKPQSTNNIYDNSLVDKTFTYTFDNQGKVVLYIFTYNGAGTKMESIQTSPSYDPQVNSKWEQRMVSTPATTSSKIETGTYKIKGKSIHLEFPAYVIDAIIYVDSMEGTLIYKDTNQKEKWTLQHTSKENNREQNSLMSDYTDFVKRTSKEQNSTIYTSSDNQNKAVRNNSINLPIPAKKSISSVKLTVGTYKVATTQSAIYRGVNLKENITFEIKVENIDEKGNVKARLYLGGGEGRINGRVDEKGLLQLEGLYINSSNQEWSFKLKANVEDNTLNNGSFINSNLYIDARGLFSTSVLEK